MLGRQDNLISLLLKKIKRQENVTKRPNSKPFVAENLLNFTHLLFTFVTRVTRDSTKSAVFWTGQLEISGVTGVVIEVVPKCCPAWLCQVVLVVPSQLSRTEQRENWQP
jgi:hypothetical protein